MRLTNCLDVSQVPCGGPDARMALALTRNQKASYSEIQQVIMKFRMRWKRAAKEQDSSPPVEDGDAEEMLIERKRASILALGRLAMGEQTAETVEGSPFRVKLGESGRPTLVVDSELWAEVKN